MVQDIRREREARCAADSERHAAAYESAQITAHVDMRQAVNRVVRGQMRGACAARGARSRQACASVCYAHVLRGNQ